jgi:DNA-binding transcriptional LysR family regulator
VLFVPAGHALARRGAPPQALAGQELVLRERGSITREVLEQAMAAADIRPSAIVEVQTREGVREAVAAGFGIGAVFESELGDDRRFRPSPCRMPISPSPNMPCVCRSGAGWRWSAPSWTKPPARVVMNTSKNFHRPVDEA